MGIFLVKRVCLDSEKQEEKRMFHNLISVPISNIISGFLIICLKIEWNQKRSVSIM